MQRPLTLRRIVGGALRRTRYIAEGVGSIGPKLWYGNSAGLFNNLGASAELRRLRGRWRAAGRLTPPSPNAVSDANSVSKSGYVCLPPQLSVSEIRQLCERTADILRNEIGTVNSPNGATRFVLDPLGQVPELRSFLSEGISRIVTAHYECGFRIESVRVWRNFHVPGVDQDSDDRFSNTFHHDNCPTNGLRIFVLLNDGVTRDTGALRFHDRPTSERLIRSLGYFHRNLIHPKTRRFLSDRSRLHYFEGDAGAICICNTQQCLHAASIPMAGTMRDILQFEIYPSVDDSTIAGEIWDSIPPDLEILEMRAQSK